MPIVAAEAFGALPKLRIRLVGLTDTGEQARRNERRVIETILRRQPELLSYRQRRELRADAYGPVVGEDPENALRLFTFVISLVRTCYHCCVCATRFRLRACVRRLGRGLLPAQRRLFLRNCWRSRVFRRRLRDRGARPKRNGEGNGSESVASQAEAIAQRPGAACGTRRDCYDQFLWKHEPLIHRSPAEIH